MRMSLFAKVGIAGLAILWFSAAQAVVTLVPIPPVTGSSDTGVFGINDSNVIVGNWYDSDSVEHGYFGTVDGNYTTFDYTGTDVVGTEPRGISDDGYIDGWAPDTDFLYGYEFVRGPDGSFATVTEGKGNKAVPLDGIAQGITKNDTFSGDHWLYVGSQYIRYAYVGKAGKWQQDLSLPFGSTRQAARGINKNGVVIGFFLGSDGNTHGFLLQNGVAHQIDYPNSKAVGTYLEGINDNGLVTGQWDDKNGNPSGFMLDTATNTFTSIKIPGSTYVQPFGVNNSGLIVVGSDAGNFIYCPKKANKCPGGGTEIADGPTIRAAAGAFWRIDASRGSDLTTHVPPQAPLGKPFHGPGRPALP